MFEAKSIELSSGFELSALPGEVFDLFSPLGEKLWVPEWDPELIHPPGVTWAHGLIFRTQEERGEAIWVVTVFDRARHEVEYVRVESGRYVARVNVQCRGDADLRTEVRVVYTFVGLSEAGNREIEAMSKQSYEEKMKRWQAWINRYLSHAPS